MNFTPVQSLASNHVILNTLGILAVTNALLLFFSCRFVPMLGEAFNKKILQNKVYKFIYKYHPYYWWSFWLIIVLHIMMAIAHTVYGP